jgi:hypothetical protein
MTHRQALQGFPDRVKYRSENQLTEMKAVPAGNWEVTVSFNFISERTLYRLPLYHCPY